LTTPPHTISFLPRDAMLARY